MNSWVCPWSWLWSWLWPWLWSWWWWCSGDELIFPAKNKKDLCNWAISETPDGPERVKWELGFAVLSLVFVLLLLLLLFFYWENGICVCGNGNHKQNNMGKGPWKMTFGLGNGIQDPLPPPPSLPLRTSYQPLDILKLQNSSFSLADNDYNFYMAYSATIDNQS